MVNMFGNKELQILYYVSRGRCTLPELSESLGISMPEIYRKIRSLRAKDVVEGKTQISISRCPFAKRLMWLMSDGPGTAKYLSGACLDVLVSIVIPRSLSKITEMTGISESHVRKILRTEMEGNMVQNVNGLYGINDDGCPKLRPFLNSYIDYTEVSDPRITNDSEVIFRNGADVVFSSADSQGYRPTGITAFKDYGMKGASDMRGFYTTRDGEMSIDMVFDDALRIAEAENDWRLRMANELFYIKNSDKLRPSPQFLEIHGRIMSGEHIGGWPSKKDLDDRMWMVDG